MLVFHVTLSVLANITSSEKVVLAMEKLGSGHIGSHISITSKSEIRYEGIFCTLDTESSTIVLENVRSFGREARGNNIRIRASDEVFGYVTFRDVDIKDLNVIAPRVRSNDPATAQFNAIGDPLKHSIHGTVLLNDDTLVPDVLMFDTMLPHYAIWKTGTNWSSCNCPTAASSIYSGVQPPLVFGHPTLFNSFYPGIQWERQKLVFPLFLEGVYGPSVPLQQAKLNSTQDPCMNSSIFADFQYEGCNRQLPGFLSTSLERLIANNQQLKQEIFPMEEPKVNSEPEKWHSASMQPLLPLPVSESQHMQLIKESVLRGNQNHLGRGRSRRRGRGRVVGTYNTEAVAQTMHKYRNDFDFEAMNQQFNKKEVWKELGLGEKKVSSKDGKKEGPPSDLCEEIISDTIMCHTSKKPLFVEDFFDFLSCDDLDCKENRSERKKLGQQRKIDRETFGTFPLRSYVGRGGHKPGGLHRGSLHAGNLSNKRLGHETSGSVSVKD